MRANQQFTLVAFALSSIACFGTTLALISLDDRHDGRAGNLRPSLEDSEQAAPVPVPQLALRPSRFAYLPPEAQSLDWPPSTDEISGAEALPQVAASPESWTVEVQENDNKPVTGSSASRRGQVAKTTAKARQRRYTLRERLKEISPSARGRIIQKFASAKAVWPPTEISLVAIKDERSLELYSRSGEGAWTFIHRYRVLAASGGSGPKLIRGDKQVPEGIYRISYLNPNSSYHVSLRVNYPNAFDREMAALDGRKDLGGDIMIHGKNLSAGCLAMGDEAAEELFDLAAEVGLANIQLIIAPTDFRKKPLETAPQSPKWVPALYTQVAGAMAEFKAPQQPGLLTLLGF